MEKHQIIYEMNSCSEMIQLVMDKEIVKWGWLLLNLAPIIFGNALIAVSFVTFTKEY